MMTFDIEIATELSAGTEVEVLTRFEPHWTSGFEIAAVVDGGLTLRRHSDGTVLPVAFGAHELRRRR